MSKRVQGWKSVSGRGWLQGSSLRIARVTINEYLDAVKAVLRCHTDTELALRLRVLQSRISNYRTGRTLPDLRMARVIAATLNLRSGAVISDIRNERALRGVQMRRKAALA